MAEPTLRDVLDELATLRGIVAHQGARLARYERRDRRRRLPRRLLPHALAALLVALVPLAALAATPFTDLTGGPHDGNVDAIYTAGITRGCGPTSYCPTASVTRKEMVSFLARTAGLGGNPPIANALTAVNATSAGDAATVGGYAPSGLVRVARARGVNRVDTTPPTPLLLTVLANAADPALTPFQPLATATVVVPGDGFVLVLGNVQTVSGYAAQATVRLRDARGGATSPLLSGGGSAAIASALAPAHVFPVAAGERTFVLEGAKFDASVVGTEVYAYDAVITALFIPFGHDGGTTLAP